MLNPEMQEKQKKVRGDVIRGEGGWCHANRRYKSTAGRASYVVRAVV